MMDCTDRLPSSHHHIGVAAVQLGWNTVTRPFSRLSKLPLVRPEEERLGANAVEAADESSMERRRSTRFVVANAIRRAERSIGPIAGDPTGAVVYCFAPGYPSVGLFELSCGLDWAPRAQLSRQQHGQRLRWDAIGRADTRVDQPGHVRKTRCRQTARLPQAHTRKSW